MDYAEGELDSVLADSMMDIQFHLALCRMQVSYSTVLDKMLSGHLPGPGYAGFTELYSEHRRRSCDYRTAQISATSFKIVQMLKRVLPSKLDKLNLLHASKQHDEYAATMCTKTSRPALSAIHQIRVLSAIIEHAHLGSSWFFSHCREGDQTCTECSHIMSAPAGIKTITLQVIYWSYKWPVLLGVNCGL